MSGPPVPFIEEVEPTLVDVLDRLLDRGVVIWGDARISVADVDLVFVGVKLILASIDTIEDARETTLRRALGLPAAAASAA